VERLAGQEREKARSVGERSLSGAVQVKICGLMDEVQAARCAEMGADAIGLVFYPKSPRNLSDEKARTICSNLPLAVCTVGVFVNENYDTIMRRVELCGLRGVQLHGNEKPDLVTRLREKGLVVVKALFVNGNPSLALADQYPASAFLIEAAGGPLPGGNAMNWNWSEARDLACLLPTVLAGGLNAENVKEAIQAALPDAVDVSSGVEASPGRKDLDKVRHFLSRVRDLEGVVRSVRQIFP
jgi:phosphoribosylanthranilate isomerase